MPTRLFRADTPHDIACATVVAESLPSGRDFLAVSTDKVLGEPQGIRSAMEGVASMHAWERVIDISGLPIRPFLFSRQPGATFLTHARAIAASSRLLESRLVSALLGEGGRSGVARSSRRLKIDELYLTCYQHPDVQVMYAMFPCALKAYYPHGFDSVHGGEIEAHSHYFTQRTPRRRLRDALVDSLKRAAGGRGSVLPREMVVDVAYTFNLDLPWAVRNVQLGSVLTRGKMKEFFERLPAGVKNSYSAAANRHGGRALLVLFPPFDWPEKSLNETQRMGMAALCAEALKVEGSTELLLKPHPRNTSKDVDRQVEAIASAAPGAQMTLLRDFGAYPIEMVLHPFRVSACVSLGSTSSSSLREIYGIRSYVSERVLTELYSSTPALSRAMNAWMNENRRHYVSL